MVLPCRLVLLVALVAVQSTLGAFPHQDYRLNSIQAAAAKSPPLRVVFDHDGGIDDFAALALLLAQPHKVDLLAVSIIDADCYGDLAVNTTVKLLRLAGRTAIPIMRSTLKAVNAFPAAWRGDGLSTDVLPLLNAAPAGGGAYGGVGALRRRQLVPGPGQDALARLLEKQREPVTLIMTGPLSNLAYLLKRRPAAAATVARVWWMGGALWRPGNVAGQPRAEDGRAEWNAFWDPEALGVVWGSSIELTLVPLDATNQVPITPDLVRAFGSQSGHLFSNLLGQIWAPEVLWVYKTPDAPYYAWDVLAAACALAELGGEDLCDSRAGLLSRAVMSGPAQGATLVVGSGGGDGGGRLSAVKELSAVVAVDPGRFLDFLLRATRG